MHDIPSQYMHYWHQRKLFIQLIYSCFSPDQVPINSVAPFSVYKPCTTHNSSIRSDEGLSNARNVSFSISIRWLIYIINSVDKPNFRMHYCVVLLREVYCVIVQGLGTIVVFFVT